MMNLAERLLSKLSREEGENLRPASLNDMSHAMVQLESSFPDFSDILKGKRVLDFGCGEGCQALAMAEKGAAFVLGIDIDTNDIAKAKGMARRSGILGRVEFANAYQAEHHGKFDLILSHNSFEHFKDPVSILKLLKSALAPSGKIYITFGPPWLAPYGAHMQFFCKLPWIHLFFSEKTIMNIRSRYRSDGARCFDEVEGGLNKMTVGRFEKILLENGLKITNKKYECIKKLNFFSCIPFFRELFINQVSCRAVLA